MGNHPAAPFEAGSFTERFAAHSRVAYYPYPLDAPCQVLVPFVIDQLLIGADVIADASALNALSQSATPIGTVFSTPPQGNEVQIWRLDQITDAQQFPDVAHFVWKFRNDVLAPANIPFEQVAPNHVLIPAPGDFHQCPFGPPDPADPRDLPEMVRPTSVDVAVIDSGWEQEDPAKGLVGSHAYAKWLKQNAEGGYEWASTVAAAKRLPTGMPGEGRLGALTAHSNFIVGLIAQACPSASISVESLNALFVETDSADPAIPTEAAVARALWERRANDLIHVGFAFPTLPNTPLTPEDAATAGPPSWALNVVLDALPKVSPPVIVAPAGNQSCAVRQYPAAFGTTHSNVIGVGSVDAGGQRSVFSNHGPWVTCCTEGEDVVSTFLSFDGETEEAEPDGSHPAKTFDGWASWSGTSFASPKVTGALARLIADGATPAAAWTTLTTGASSPAALDMGIRLEGLTPAPAPVP